MGLNQAEVWLNDAHWIFSSHEWILEAEETGAKQCHLHRRLKTQIHARYEILPLKQKDFIKRESTMKQTEKCLEEEPFYKTFLPDPEQFEKIKKVNILPWPWREFDG